MQQAFTNNYHYFVKCSHQQSNSFTRVLRSEQLHVLPQSYFSKYIHYFCFNILCVYHCCHVLIAIAFLLPLAASATSTFQFSPISLAQAQAAVAASTGMPGLQTSQNVTSYGAPITFLPPAGGKFPWWYASYVVL